MRIIIIHMCGCRHRVQYCKSEEPQRRHQSDIIYLNVIGSARQKLIWPIAYTYYR